MTDLATQTKTEGIFPAPAPLYEQPYTLTPAAEPEAPVLFASPHSGVEYPDHVRAQLQVPLMDLRRTEDAFMDDLFGTAPECGGALLAARYGRMVTDLNRDARELDVSMFLDGAPRTCGVPTARVEAGLGCLPKVSVEGEAIYKRLLSRAEGEARLSQIHDAYHAKLSAQLSGLKERHGIAFLVDCHSMPSVQPGRRTLPDVVLGDRFGSSCHPKLVGKVERAFRKQGLSVARNAPYAGGYTTRKYGRPKRFQHALQIEINRGLYMDEQSIKRLPTYDKVKAIVSAVSDVIVKTAHELAP